jgi:hypothetical protein
MPAPAPAIHYLELGTPEVEGACRAYEAAMGWAFQSPVPELGQARVAQLTDGSWCGIRAPLFESEAPVMRTYLRVADLDAATQAAAESGATVLLESMDLPGWGRISIVEIGSLQQGFWQVP